jgi:anti-anti-sigma regulatory factor
MDIARHKTSGIEVVTISGRVSGAEVPRLAGEFQSMKAAAGTGKPVRVVLDVAKLDNLPSAVVGSLIEAIRASESIGGRLVLAGPNHALVVVLERLGIADLVSCFKSAGEAIKSLSLPPGTPTQ